VLIENSFLYSGEDNIHCSFSVLCNDTWI